jgi:hypothetical protein
MMKLYLVIHLSYGGETHKMEQKWHIVKVHFKIKINYISNTKARYFESHGPCGKVL